MPNVIEKGYEITKQKGRINFSWCSKKRIHNINIFTLPLHFGKTITGSHGGESNPQ